MLAGFGILRFVVHSCGLHYITLSPLLLRVSLGCCGCAEGLCELIACASGYACLLMLMLHCC